MSDIIGNDRHDWQRGDSYQWGLHGAAAYGQAQTPYECAKCGASFVHYYHQQPNIYIAMEGAGINPDKCG